MGGYAGKGRWRLPQRERRWMCAEIPKKNPPLFPVSVGRRAVIKSSPNLLLRGLPAWKSTHPGAKKVPISTYPETADLRGEAWGPTWGQILPPTFTSFADFKGLTAVSISLFNCKMGMLIPTCKVVVQVKWDDA